MASREEGGVRLKAERCIGCERCVEACVLGAMLWNEAEHTSRRSASNAAIGRPTAPMTSCAWGRCPMLHRDLLPRVLIVDLSRRRWSVEERPALFENLGGAGVASRLLAEECPECGQPLSQE
jgi:Fe-S-cluster-containing hydrogenase component 2